MGFEGEIMFFFDGSQWLIIVDSDDSNMGVSSGIPSVSMGLVLNCSNDLDDFGVPP